MRMWDNTCYPTGRASVDMDSSLRNNIHTMPGDMPARLVGKRLSHNYTGLMCNVPYLYHVIPNKFFVALKTCLMRRQNILFHVLLNKFFVCVGPYFKLVICF